MNLSKSPSSRWYQPADWAGVQSSELGISYEPPLQHKRRIRGPPTSLSTEFYEASVDNHRQYALLGQQQKFANNVRYPLKGTSSSVQSTNSKDKVAVDRRPNDKDASPSKQIKIDLKREEKADVRTAQMEVKDGIKTPKSPPPAPREPRKVHSDPVKLDMPDKNLSDVLQKEVARRTETNVEPKMQEHENRNKNILPKSETMVDQEHVANHALKYKAGIAPSRKTLKISEYRKEFNWKQGSPASPLLNAEQMVYKGSLQNAPQRINVLSKSEYQRQFQPRKVQDPVPLKTSSIHDYPPKFQEKFQVKRSKSVGDNLPAAGSSLETSWQDPRQVEQSAESTDNVKILKNSKPPIDYGKLRHTVTEYRANYRSPTSCSYNEGAWRGASPPHLFQEKVTEQELGEERDTRLSNWFAEVVELRQRAQEYKRRAQGTHFSREHLAQLLAQQTGSWDMGSSDSVTSLDALALEPGTIFSRERNQPVGQSCKQKVGVPLKGVQNEYNVHEEGGQQQQANAKGPKAAWEENMENAKKAEAEAGMVSDDQLDNVGEQTKQERGPEDRLELKVCKSNEKNTPEDVADIEGRMPTPVLRQQAVCDLQPKILRHHLDLTTPCVGGVLLSSVDDKMVTSRSGDTCLTKSNERISPKTSFAEKLLTSPIYGKPTPDTHALRDDDSLSDRPLEMKYVPSPPPANTSPSKGKKSKFQNLNLHIPKTIDENMGDTYKVTQRNFKLGDGDKTNSADDDLLSVSAMSIASSNSRAYEVYERAKKRRDHFWSQKSGPAAC